jgi:DNA-binding CsgD family transcriptional regulator
VDDQETIARALYELAALASGRADYAVADAQFEESLLISQGLGRPFILANVLMHFGFSLFRRGEHERAQTCFEQSATLLRELHNKNILPVPLRGLGHVALRRYEHARATALFAESLILNAEIKDQDGVASSLGALAGVAIAQHKFARAAQLFGIAESLLESIHGQPTGHDRLEYDHNLASAREQLSASDFNAAWEAGQQMTLEQVIAEAERLTADPQVPLAHPATPLSIGSQTPMAHPAGLTAREVEVLRWLAQGLTDAQIAETLVVSPRTVNSHLRSIFSKLDVTTRTAAARRASELNLK